ncbi:MAG TPA: DinB family protein [Thermomicrobiaceae bacterium]|nr:DinB family protein [Thermomicrobiaceae bacterium]
MSEDRLTLRRFYQGWDAYQRLLVEAIAPLSEEQLALRAAPSLRPVWLLAAHIVGTRVGWFHGRMGEGGPEIAALDPWDAEGAPPRGAAELIDGLETTWRMIAECLDRWTPADLDATFVRDLGDRTVTRSRQWIIWHVIEHDLHHGGELFLTLGMHGLPTPDL